MNPFEILELSPGASSDEVKAAYHRLAKKWHPDRYSGAEKVEAEERFRKLAEAFNMLKDSVRRGELEAQFARQAPTPASASSPARPIAERTADDWMEDARAAFADRDYGRALGLVQCALRLDGSRAEAHLLLADVLEKGGGDRRALVKALEEATRHDPKNVEALLRLSEVYRGLGMQARAATVRESARILAPNHKAFRPAPTPTKKAPPPEKGGLMDQLSALAGRLFKKG